jgi:DNA modification methylase
MEGMKEFPDKYFDLAIVDPPYGININNNIGRRKGDRKSNYPKAYWDNTIPDDNYFAELFRVSKQQIIWGATIFIFHQQNVFWYGESHKYLKMSVSQWSNLHGHHLIKRQKNGLE